MPLFVDYLEFNSIVLSLLIALFFCFVAKRTKLIFSYGDPFILPVFQVVFSFFLVFINSLIGYKELADFVVFFFILMFANFVFSKVKKVNVVGCDIFDGFAKFILLVSVIFNIILFFKKGVIFLSADVGAAKVEFYRGAGLFKRINQLSIPILTIYSFRAWFFVTAKYSKQVAVVVFLFVCYLLMTMGAKSGLIVLIFYYFTFIYFSRKKLNYKFVFLMVASSLFATMVMFSVIYGDKAIGFLVYRLMSFADGPVYYFASARESIEGTLSVFYPFEQLAVSLRLFDESSLSSLGPMINRIHFGLNDGLYGPNPQIFVEADAILGEYALIYLIISSVFIAFIKNLAANEYSYVLFSAMFIPFFIDSQYAFNNFFNLLILMFLFSGYFVFFMIPFYVRKSYLRPKN
ncbi:hypothetical protein HGP28_11590 [Vibrio sp. SM6]|uniref:Uncharacterized protein n=1 Tax=Vibrio agarilyticus TaxID=2726741 RepID=A0A7X8TRP5_9VIBR|nr:hypothetical protein [Vibrio agarilyticus]NLS13534.1 hypothetical protein [Vibrio agarilyticus]